LLGDAETFTGNPKASSHFYVSGGVEAFQLSAALVGAPQFETRVGITQIRIFFLEA
jgi:hypothetical protein